MDKKKENLELLRAAWDAYHPEYMEFHLKEWPDFMVRNNGLP
jgi:hypothetical protein